MKEFELHDSLGSRKEFFFYSLSIIAIGIFLYYLLRNIQQTIAGTVFIALVIGTLMFWRFRVAIAFIGIVLLMVTKTIDLKHTIEFMSLDVILFLIGMMVIVGFLRRSGFFKWFLSMGLELSGFKPHRMLVIIIVLSAVMAALVDEVTSILFTTALVLDFCDFYKINPIKLIIVVVLATNIGSSWTVLGNPIGILIALRSGLTFEDFLQTAFPVGVLSLLSIIIISFIWLRKDLRSFKEVLKETSSEEKQGFLDELEKIEDRRLFRGSAVIFFSVILLLALHHRLELMLGLELNTLLVGTSIFGAGIAMLWQRSIARELLMKEVDWWTLVFFMFLFAKAGALKYVGLTDIVAKGLYDLAGGGQESLLIVFVLWLSGITSAAADNVVVVATFIPVIQYLTDQMGTSMLWWSLLFGGCYGGNMTMVGSTANIIALGILEDRKGYHMHLKFWIKIGIWAAFVPMAIGTIALIVISKFG